MCPGPGLRFLPRRGDGFPATGAAVLRMAGEGTGTHTHEQSSYRPPPRSLPTPGARVRHRWRKGGGFGALGVSQGAPPTSPFPGGGGG